jgi:hypothetical protein
MSMENKFAEAMVKRTYAELHEIVGKLRNEYEPEAVAAAEAEVARRNLTGEKIEPKENIFRTQKKLIADKANAPLQIYWKIITFLLPGLLILLFADDLKAEGYERRYKEVWRWFFYGAGFYIGLLILLVIGAALFT